MKAIKHKCEGCGKIKTFRADQKFCSKQCIILASSPLTKVTGRKVLQENYKLRRQIQTLLRGKIFKAKMNGRPQRWIIIADLHHPLIHLPTWGAVKTYLKQNKIDGVILLGDQFDNACISHHNFDKPLYRIPGAYQSDESSFITEFLNPLEKLIGRHACRVWIIGNHDDWEYEYIETHPELQGIIDRPTSLKLKQRGWTVLPLGGDFKLGKLTALHGESLSGKNPAQKAMDIYNGSTISAHVHAPQVVTKMRAGNESDKHQGYVCPIMGSTSPTHMRGKPSPWMNGFAIVEVHSNGNFNCYLINVIDGTFSYGGKTYSATK